MTGILLSCISGCIFHSVSVHQFHAQTDTCQSTYKIPYSSSFYTIRFLISCSLELQLNGHSNPTLSHSLMLTNEYIRVPALSMTTYSQKMFTMFINIYT